MHHANTNQLGIGIITRNRLAVLQRCVAEVAHHTRSPYVLVVADDGSSDDTVVWARSRHLPVVTGARRGVVWNKNRALYYLQQHTDCDPIVLIEDDVWPVTTGWDDEWAAAARRWQHVNYRYDVDPRGTKGRGTADDPFQSPRFSGHCTITTRRALTEVGFLDTRFFGYGWGHVEWTFRFRQRYHEDWGLPEGTFPCLVYGVTAIPAPSSCDAGEEERNADVYNAIQHEMVGSTYRAAWRNIRERLQLRQEIRTAQRASSEARRATWWERLLRPGRRVER